MKASELRTKNSNELQALGVELRRKLWKARFDNFVNQLDDTSQINKLRKDIAKVKTVERELESSAS